MKKSIWKFTFDIKSKVVIPMPKGAKILTAQLQEDKPCMWAVVDTENKKEDRYFEIFGTGHPFPVDIGINRVYINTIQIDNLVFHIFERTDNHFSPDF